MSHRAIDRRAKWVALRNYAGSAPMDVGRVALLAFLAGRLDQVHFVRDLEGARVTLRLTQSRRLVVPGPPFQAVVDGVPIPNPMLFIAAMAERDDAIYVQLEFDGAEDADWYQAVLEESAGEAGGNLEEDPRWRIELLRERVNHALDVYRECRRLLAEGHPEREAELKFFLSMARTEMADLSREIRELGAQLPHPEGEPPGPPEPPSL
ncbi:MAG: hypothetical protein QJR14_05115 [Bacillota bacterium]|nr:hypothetical protein [Bacillota bacterium]